MKFRVLGMGMVVGVSVWIVGHAGAQTAPIVTQPAAAEPAPTPEAAPAPAPAPAPVKQLTPTPPPPHAAQSDGGSREASTPESSEQANFGFGAQIGFYNPNGLSVRAGAPAISLEVSAGFVPVLLSYGDSQHPDLKFLFPFEVSPQLVIHAVTFRNGITGAALLGYRYNVVLGHGATLGGQIEKRISRKLVAEGMLGFSYYPDAADRLRGDQVPVDTSFNFPPQLSEGITVGLLFYP